MKALYFTDRLRDIEASVSRQSPTLSSGARQAGLQATVVGSDVYRANLFKALLRYSTYDRFFTLPFPISPDGDLRDSPLFRQNKDRVQEMYEYELGPLAEYSPAAMVTSTTHLDRLSRLRRLSGCNRLTITGTIHSLNYALTLKVFLHHLMAPLDGRDALICSSQAGKTAVLNLLDLLGRRLEAAGWPKLTRTYRLPVIPLGVEVSDFENVDGSGLRASLQTGPGPMVLYFGRFSSRSKGDLLPMIVAFSRLSAMRPQPTLVLAGDDTQFNMGESLLEFARSLSPASQVRVVANPDAETKRKLFAAADIFVSPSDSLQETFGITVIEAAAAGLPAVVSDWNGYKELVVNGTTGFRVRTLMPQYAPRFDELRGTGEMLRPDLLAATTMISVEGMAEAMRTLIAQPERRRAMGDAARMRVRASCDWRVVIAAYEDLWAEQAAEAARAPLPETGADIEQFGYRDVFSHYPTASLTDDSIVRLSAIGEEWKSSSFDWLSRASDQAVLSGVFHRQVFEQIMEALRGRDGVTVSALIDGLHVEDDADRVWRTAHLCRLIKYGVVESADAIEVDVDLSADQFESEAASRV